MMSLSSLGHSQTVPELTVRQQPARARMCGFSDTKDRRLIDPPPILQLIFRPPAPAPPLHVVHSLTPTLICHVSLWSADGTEERNLVLNPRASSPGPGDEPEAGEGPWGSGASGVEMTATHIALTGGYGGIGPGASRLCQALLGSLVSPCYVLQDTDGTEGMFFILPDLSVRMGGTYRLRFQVVDVGVQQDPKCIASILSDPFQVYPPKTFPGMSESTPISKCFARQGIPIHIRKDYAAMREGVPAAFHLSSPSSSAAALPPQVPPKAGSHSASQSHTQIRLDGGGSSEQAFDGRSQQGWTGQRTAVDLLGLGQGGGGAVGESESVWRGDEEDGGDLEGSGLKSEGFAGGWG